MLILHHQLTVRPQETCLTSLSPFFLEFNHRGRLDGLAHSLIQRPLAASESTKGEISFLAQCATLCSHLQLRRGWKDREELEMRRAGGTVGILRAPPYQEKVGCPPFPQAQGEGLQQEGLI